MNNHFKGKRIFVFIFSILSILSISLLSESCHKKKKSFTIGGNISGLTTEGLILQNNGADNLNISSGATHFTFPTPVAEGGGYNVTVFQQPTGLTCTVSNGSGTNIHENVTNISIVCSSITYTIGGTITGLNANGLVLQNNGDDDLSISSGATNFTFPTPVAQGGGYNVTVFQQPTGLTCTVSNGVGSNVQADVNNVAISCVPTSCSATTTLQYTNANCSPTGGCTLTFSCSLPSSQPVTFDMNISSLTINQPALLQASAGVAPTQWYNTPVSCSRIGDDVTCITFLPIASDFTIQGTLDTLSFILDVTVTDAISPIATNASNLTTGCGQFGTTVQRMFDCSMRVTNFAGIGQSGGASTPFTPGTPDPNWFLVGCPIFGGGTTSQQCVWLSPVIQAGNPSIGINRNPVNTGTQDTTSPDIGPGAASRILWSGSLNNSATYNFWQANGTNAALDPNPGAANCNGSGQCAQYNSGSPTFTFNTYITTNASTVGLPNACAARIMANDNAFSGMTTLLWILPSYPIMLTLSGGSSCLFGTTNTNCNGQGFSATSSPVPSFLSDGSDPSYLWSSSVFVSNDGWEFVGLGGDVVNDGLTSSSGVRCVSAAW